MCLMFVTPCSLTFMYRSNFNLSMFLIPKLKYFSLLKLRPSSGHFLLRLTSIKYTIFSVVIYVDLSISLSLYLISVTAK